TGAAAITKVYKRDEFFRDRGHLETGPDMVIGYAKGTRCSSESALGEIHPEVISDNLTDWTGDHGMDHETVPGVLFASRPLARPVKDLKDLAGALVAEFGGGEFPVR
ncbi:MAG: hypothetical protein GTO46_07860, partial [Gemmatimonadetes bacterium]|nr:hypothetical protein [Gemmatimonadota bacterium]